MAPSPSACPVTHGVCCARARHITTRRACSSVQELDAPPRQTHPERGRPLRRPEVQPDRALPSLSPQRPAPRDNGAPQLRPQRSAGARSPSRVTTRRTIAETQSAGASSPDAPPLYSCRSCLRPRGRLRIPPRATFTSTHDPPQADSILAQRLRALCQRERNPAKAAAAE